MRILIAEIVVGERAPGDMLPRETDIAERFSVSRGVARECIRGLEERGLISVRHGKGATVNPPSAWNEFDPDVLAALLEGPKAVEVLSEYIECRRILGVEAAGLAAERAMPAAIDAIRASYARMEESTKQVLTATAEQLYHEADIAFHEALIGATGNKALGNLVQRLHSSLLTARYPLARPQNRVERALPEHRRILDAIASGDADEARAAMRDHLETVEEYLRDHAAEHSDAPTPRENGRVTGAGLGNM
jgi:DNA-binding FadR family transcriptional regulator